MAGTIISILWPAWPHSGPGGGHAALADYARRVVGEGCEETLCADSHAPGVQRGPDSVLRHR